MGKVIDNGSFLPTVLAMTLGLMLDPGFCERYSVFEMVAFAWVSEMLADSAFPHAISAKSELPRLGKPCLVKHWGTSAVL